MTAELVARDPAELADEPSLAGPVMRGERMRGLWCVVRYHCGEFCGPLSDVDRGMGGFFPRGRVGLVTWFTSREEARAGKGSGPEDVPTAVEDLHFSTREFNRRSGVPQLLYDGGDFRMATAAKWIREGEIRAVERDYTVEVWVECVLIKDKT